MKEFRKYKIDEMMNQLNVPKYKAALRIIPKTLGIAFNTFHNYRKLKVGNKSDIPYKHVRKLEILFKVKEGGLANFKTECKSLDTLIREEEMQ